MSARTVNNALTAHRITAQRSVSTRRKKTAENAKHIKTSTKRLTLDVSKDKLKNKELKSLKE